MNINLKPLAITTALGGMAMLLGCGGSGQDEASVSSLVPVSGLVLDGRMARARVFVDSNTNGKREAFEPQAYTDDQGYYSYNPISNTNYCSLPDTDALYKHCLQGARNEEAYIVVEGGYDLVTGDPGNTILRARVSVSDDTEDYLSPAVVSPITTITSFAPAEDVSRLLSIFNVDPTGLTRDYYNFGALPTPQPVDVSLDINLIKATQVVHRTVEAMSSIVQDTYSEFGNNEDLPTSPSLDMYKNLSFYLNDRTVISDEDATNTSISDALDNAALGSVYFRTVDDLVTRYASANITLPERPEPTSVDDFLTNVTLSIDVTTGLIDSLPNDVVPTAANAGGHVKAVQVLTDKIIKERPADEIERTIALLSDNNSNIQQTLISELQNASTSTTILTENDFNFGDEADVRAITEVDYEGIFESVGGRKLVIGEASVSEEKDILAIIYFNPESETVTNKGTLEACVRYVDGLNSQGQLDSAGTLGTFDSAGSWSSISEGYGILLDLNLAGAQFQVTIQYGGTNGENQHIYRTDFDDELSEWTGDEAPTEVAESATIPTNDSECETALNSEKALAFTVNP